MIEVGGGKDGWEDWEEAGRCIVEVEVMGYGVKEEVGGVKECKESCKERNVSKKKKRGGKFDE